MLPLFDYPKKYLEETIPESLAMMVSFLLSQLRDAKTKEKAARDEADRLRNVNEIANKEIQRLTKELLERKEAAKGEE